MKTFLPTRENATHTWHVIDADGAILGRLATQIAVLLRGKHKAEFTPSVDTGDGVIVINAAKVRLTGRKARNKMVYRHSGYAGGFKAIAIGDVLKTRPQDVITDAVRGMLPKNAMGRKLITRLKVYGGAEHPHFAQKPKKFALKG